MSDYEKPTCWIVEDGEGGHVEWDRTKAEAAQAEGWTVIVLVRWSSVQEVVAERDELRARVERVRALFDMDCGDERWRSVCELAHQALGGGSDE